MEGGSKLMGLRDSCLSDGGEEMGMTDMQFKAYLLEQLENWQEVLDLAKKTNDTEVMEKAKQQITKINAALNI
jgi:DnaJ-domain-containing protein 1